MATVARPGKARAPVGPPRVLIVDDEAPLRTLVGNALTQEGIDVVTAGNALEAGTLLDRTPFDLVLLDLRLGKDNGLDLVSRIEARVPPPLVVIITGYGTVEGAVQAMRMGSYDYLVKPFELANLVDTVNRALERRRLIKENHDLHADLTRTYRIDGVVGRSPAMREVYRMASIVAPTDATVLIQGETGTGKELVARSIHAQSRRANGPLVVMHCGAVPESLLETEVFGHEKGAFTGAIGSRPGRFERAEGGTIFLDEIADMSTLLQVKLLRVLQERVVERVGGTKSIAVDCRVIAATNRDLYQMVQRGEVREDLYYRLSVVPLELPPLRDRLEDLPMLAQHFLRKFRKEHGKPVRALSPVAMRTLQRHAWPGNVRELESCIRRAVILSEGEELTAADIWIAGQPQAAGVVG